MNFIRRHFPNDTGTWKKYWSIFLPVMLSQTLIALNGMIDNFMVGHIDQGVAALAAVNAWTNILAGITFGTTAVGSVLLSQFFHAKEYDTVKSIVRMRYAINITSAVILVIFAVIIPDQVIGVFLDRPDGATSQLPYNIALQHAREYMRIVIVQWILMSISFEMGSELQEMGHARIRLYTSIAMLTFHIVFNSIFLYALSFGIQGAAITSSSSRLITLCTFPIYIHLKHLPNAILPWTVFRFKLARIGWLRIPYIAVNTPKYVVILFLKRWIYFFSLSTTIFFITFRAHFFDIAYPPDGKLGGVGVSGIAIYGLTGGIYNVFTSTFAALPAMSANFVGSELGKNHLQQAKINSDRIKGFNTLMAMVMALFLMIIAFFVPQMKFLSSDQHDASGNLTFDSSVLLNQVRNSVFVIAGFFPIWIWFSTSYRNSQSGGKALFMPLCDWIISGPVQIAWLAIVTYVMVPNIEYLQANFWMAFFIFYTSDLLKLVCMEIYYYRAHWNHSIIYEESVTDKTKIETQEISTEISEPNQ